MQAGVSLALMGFSIAMLVRGNNPAIYVPILTGVLGIWSPNPKLQRPPANRVAPEAATPDV